MWYILDVQPGSYLYYGVKPGIDANKFKEAIEKGQVFEREVFKIRAMFEANSQLIGKEIGGIEILDTVTMGDFIVDNNIQVGIISVPKYEAQNIADQMVDRGHKEYMEFCSHRCRDS